MQQNADVPNAAVRAENEEATNRLQTGQRPPCSALRSPWYPEGTGGGPFDRTDPRRKDRVAKKNAKLWSKKTKKNGVKL